jgi:serine protease AprX
VKKIILVALLLNAFCTAIFGQQAPSIYVIKFTDKNNAPFNLNSPLDFLSQRAIDRRTNQSIGLSAQDFPVNASYVNQIAALGAQILNRSKWLNAVAVYSTDTIVIQNIQNLPLFKVLMQ